jgi:hypothetical protein
MVAGNGTFSGTFSAQNINAISHVNVRDGAVSAYIGFNFPQGSTSAAFAVPGQVDASVADITIPLSVLSYGPSTNFPGYITLYKNGQLLQRASIGLATTIGFFQVARFIDSDVSGTSYYQVVLQGSTFTYYITRTSSKNGDSSVKREGSLSLGLIGAVTVGFRKR